MILIDNQDRSKLCEGRNSGLGFAFCEKDGATLTTVMPLTACKDFLNDVVYSEGTGKPFSIYGLSTVKLGIFEDGAYMAMGILPQNRTVHKRPEHDKLEAALMAPQTGVAWLLSYFEDKMGVMPTIWFDLGSNRMGCRLDKFWIRGTYLISLWSLLIRVGLKFKPGSPMHSNEPMDFLKAVNDEDAYMVKAAIPKLERMMAGEIPVQDMNTMGSPHNVGIVTFSFQITKA